MILQSSREENLMKWKPLFGVLLGLLMVGLSYTSALSSYDSKQAPSLPPYKEKPIPTPPGIESGLVVKTFTGPSSTVQAKSFLNQYWDKLTLRLNLNEFQNATFVGIALRPLPSGAYAPLYYFADDSSEHLDIHALNDLFTSEVTKFADRPLSAEGALDYEPPREWKAIGRIRTITTSQEIKTERGDKVTVYNKLGADFWVTEARMGYYYYVYLTHEAKVPRKEDFPLNFRVAVKEVRERATILNPSPEQAYLGVGSFKPEGSGSSSEPTITWGLNIGIDSKGLPSAMAGFSESYTKGLVFKWYTDDIDANRDIQFEFYDLKKKGFLRSSSPAWGKIFVAHPVLVPFVKKGTPFHMVDMKLRAEADFIYEEDKAYCVGFGCTVFHHREKTSAPPIEFTVEMYPWFIYQP